MGRPKRAADGGVIYHVLNRANARLTIFEKDEDYEAFERVLHEAVKRTATRLVAYCVMPNHWHLVVWPREDGELSRFTGWLTLTHTQRGTLTAKALAADTCIKVGSSRFRCRMTITSIQCVVTSNGIRYERIWLSVRA